MANIPSERLGLRAPQSIPDLDLDLDLSRMDDINYLRCRNIQLETELRFVKEQLTLARNGTQYIIECFTKANAHNQHLPMLRYDQTPSSRQANEGHPTPQLEFNQNEHHYSYNKEQRTGFDSQPRLFNGNPDAPIARTRDGQHDQTPQEEDLLTLDADETSPPFTAVESPEYTFGKVAQATPTPDPFSMPSRPAISQGVSGTSTLTSTKNHHVGLGIQNLAPMHPRGNEVSSDVNEPRRQGFKGEADMFIPRLAQSPGQSGLWACMHAPQPSEPELVFDRVFFDGEHRRLLNSAQFIEDMTGEERELHWMRLGQEHSRHTAREWKLYYERVILPVYLTKVENATKATATLGPVEEDDQHVLEERRDSKDLADNCCIPTGQSVPSITTEAPMKEAGPLIDEKQDNDPVQGHQDLTRTASREILLPAPIIEGIDVVFTGEKANAPVFKNDKNEHSKGKTSIDHESGRESPQIEPSLSRPPPVDRHIPPRFDRRPQFNNFPTDASQVFYQGTGNDLSDFRTVLISNISTGITLAEIVSSIQSGQIVKATFLETNGMKTTPPTSTNAAMIEFLNGHDATATVKIWREERSRLPGTSTEATLIGTPTRPLHPRMEFDLRMKGLTRVFYIADETQEQTADGVMADITRYNPYIKRPLVVGRAKDHRVFFEFSDVKDAAAAWEVVNHEQRCFRGMEKGFLPDPCAQRSCGLDDELEGTSGSDADDEGDGGSTVTNTPAISFEVDDEGRIS